MNDYTLIDFLGAVGLYMGLFGLFMAAVIGVALFFAKIVFPVD